MGGWLDLGRGAEPDTKSDSETEPDEDSDNEDVHDAGDETEADEDRFQMPSTATDMSTEESPVEVEMGETTDAMEYDTEFIFRHLCFYLDTPENARKNRMTVKTKQEKAISETFSDISKSIVANGGKIVDLNDPKLTHVVLDKRDDGRRITLMQYTSKPRRRYLVISDYVQACLDEGTLLDEDVFAP